MREVVDGVFEIRIGHVHVHLIVVEDGLVLVDTGLPGRAGKVEQALQETCKKIGEVHTILLTHRHPDHVGGAAELRRRSGARVVAHMADTPSITGAAPVATGLMRVVASVMKAPEPVPVDETLSVDGPTPVAGISVVHTPGHTAGHVSYLLDRAGGVLFVGDAASGGRGGQVRHLPRILTDDRPSAAASVARIAELEFEVAVFGHGRAMTGRAVDRFRRFAAR